MTTLTGPAPADRAAPPHQPQGAWSAAWWVATAILAAVWLWTRLTGLSRSLWWDEVFTARRYVLGGAAEIFDPERYSANNHVLFSLLSSWTSRLLGTDEAVLRLWVVVPALAATAIVVWLLWRRLGPAVAVLALGLMTLSWFAAMVQTEARGYMLGALAGAALLTVSVTQAREPRWSGDLLAAGAGVVGMLAFSPVMMLYLSHAGVWLLTRRTHRIRLVVCTAAAGLVTGLVLRPLLSTMLAGADRVGSRRADPVTWWSPVIEPLGLVGGRGLEGVLPGPTWLGFWAAVVLGVLGLAVCFFRDRALALQLLAGLGGTIVLLGLVDFHLRDRYIAFLLPHVFAAMAVGAAAALGLLRRGPSVWAGGAAVVVLFVLAVPSLPAVQHETNVPLQNFKEAAERMRAEDPATLVAPEPHQGYLYYLADLELTETDGQEELDEAFCEGERPAIWVHNPDREPDQEPACIDEARMETAAHRGARGQMQWWVLE
jgi:hypothetical protein